MVHYRLSEPQIRNSKLNGKQCVTSLSHWYPGSGVVLDCIDS